MSKLGKIQQWVEGERLRIHTEQAATTGIITSSEIGVLLVACLGLMMMQFGGTPEVFKFTWGRWVEITDPYWELYHLLHWISACLIGYVVIPLLYLKVRGDQILRDYYLNPNGFFKHFLSYFILALPVFLLVIWVSNWPDFQAIYPFYSEAHRSTFDLWVWEFAYLLQFVALEFFFRAFLLEGLRKWIGYGAIFVMVVPYCMIHFQKTFAESFGSIFAGVILGWMAMRSRSIWGGVFAHGLIALEMDILSLIRKGLL